MRRTIQNTPIKKPLLLWGRGLAMGLFLLLAFSCARLPNIQGKGEVFLQGIWQQDSVANAEQMQSYTSHRFKFTCDSFYVDFSTRSKINYYEEDCYNNGIWKEYAKGIYQVRNDTLILVGTFTKDDYKQKISGCYRNGQYIGNFKVKSWNSEQLSLKNLDDHTPIILSLEEKITCIPKPL